MSPSNKMSTECGQIFLIWKNFRRFPTRRKIAWSRPASWKKTNPCRIHGPCLSGNQRNQSPARPFPSHPRNKIPSSRWPGNTPRYSETLACQNLNLEITDQSLPFQILHLFATSNSRLLWNRVLAVISKFTGTLPSARFAKQNLDLEIPKNLRRKTKKYSGLLFLWLYENFRAKYSCKK